MFKILQVRLQQYMNLELPDVQARFRKGRGTRDQIANINWIIEKARQFKKNIYFCFICFPGCSDGKASACNVGDPGSISGLGRSPGEGNGNPLQYPRLKMPWTEEPDRLHSMGSQRVRHNWAETVTDFIFLGSKITADGDCSLESKRRLLLGRKTMTNLDIILKSRH